MESDEKPLVFRDKMDPNLKEMTKRIMDNFLICFVKRAGGEVELSVGEVDAADDLLTMTYDNNKKVFILKTKART